ncbi:MULTISPECIES: hypothetical protein [Bradyrhizobium]|uniref:hypothetical protein n=1 Tax=Bradyrhizobium TaxID=374 RepID=UPI00040C9CB2|nr:MULTISPECIES: hypothetical protein [Bradyrhizobium]UFW47810.1 hypothetical protein BaraCB756_36995 [Bradyrhizobium arachidis]
MLPGFRFLLAAILLSTSILVFGLGAAALLRATHEQYVSNPSWRNGPQEKVFAQASEPAQPVLAVLRAEPEAAVELTPSLRDQVPTIGLPEQMAALTSETDAQPQVVAPPADAAPAEPAQVETKSETKIETPAETAAPAPADTLTPADTTATIVDATPAVVATASAPAPVDAAVDPSRAMAAAALDVATTRLAALNDPAAAKAAPAKAKSDTSKPESKATKPKAKKRHREVRRPPPQQLRQQFDPFGQQTFATTTTRTR